MRGDIVHKGGGRYPDSMQKSTPYGGRASWLCLTNFIAFCTTHLAADAPSIATQQSSAFSRSLDFWVGYGLQTFGVGDFNLTPANEEIYKWWPLRGYAEGDHGSWKITTKPFRDYPNGAVFDYCYRNGSWAYDAYVADAALDMSDHWWKQCYL